MVNGLIGRKLGMTSLFDKDGHHVPVTLVEVGPCTVVQIKTTDGKDGYNGVQLGFETRGNDRLTKPMQGHFKKAGVTGGFKVLREFDAEKVEELELGAQITAEDVFKESAKVRVIGTSIGKGFAGVIKRHGFHGGPASHGAHKMHRKPMSAGATDAARVFKGKKSPGHMGNGRVTTKNLEIMKIKPMDAVAAKDNGEKKEKDAKSGATRFILAIKGAVPGKAKSLVIVENV